MRGFKVVIDYCHNVDGMRRLTEFVDLTMTGCRPARPPRSAYRQGGRQRRSGRGTAVGVIGIPGDRRDQDQLEYGALAAAASFDEIIVREDVNLRGRKPGETAANVLEGIRRARAAGARCNRAVAILDELEAAEAGMRRAHPGDLVVICADDSTQVYRAAMAFDRGAGIAITAPGEMAVPEG